MPVPSGTVSVVDTTSNNTVATGTLDGSGNATLSWTAVAGTYNFVVNYSGDSNFDPGQSAPIPYVVNAVLANVVVNATVAPPSPANAGAGVTFTVGVVPA